MRSRTRPGERSTGGGGLGVSRRGLFGGGVAVGLSALGWSRALGANERVRIASIGCGGKGFSDLLDTAKSPHAEVVALCNIDESKAHLGAAAEKFPMAKTFTDWRRLLDDAGTLDAVIVSTPDHMHAAPSLAAMHLGKHVQCQKPLTHTLFEARQLRQAAERFKLVTQMGNQIQSHPAYRTAVKLVHDGKIGAVKAVHSWQAGGMPWRKLDDRPAGAADVPAGVHWDEWLGVADTRPFQPEIYHPFNWRAWQEFANGQLGDFGCHILDPVFMALGLTAPLSVRAEATPMNREVWYTKSTVRWLFPGTARTAGPTIEVTWYDGQGHKPALDVLGLTAADLPAGKDGAEGTLPNSGSVLIGTTASLVVPHVGMPYYVPAQRFADVTIEAEPARDHYTSWIDAIRGTDQTTSHFGYAGPLTETVLLGTIAIRHPGAVLGWDADAMALTGAAGASGLLTKGYRGGWQPAWV
ncbi:MAG: Gfo/Idh/MocA family protein [Pirellulales bacterium]